MARLHMFRLRSIWGNHNFDFALSLSRGYSEGIISLWDPNSFSRSNIWCHDNVVIVKGTWIRENLEVFMVNVYAPQALVDKVVIWEYIMAFIVAHPGDYILMGDWNSVRNMDERCRSDFCMEDASVFNDFIDSNALYEVPLGGLQFTWRNKALTNSVVEDLKGLVLPRGHSDHSPLLLFQDKVDFGPTYFKIFESWFARPDFEDSVRNAWEIVNADSSLDIVAKLRLLKGHLKSWVHSARSNEASRLKDITIKIDDIDILIDTGNADMAAINLRNALAAERDDISKLNDLDFLQKSRVKWDVEGDENSKFFHSSLKHKRRTQQIQGLLVDGIWIDDPNIIKANFFDSFKVKFEEVKSGAKFGTIELNYILSDDEALWIEHDIEDLEIKRAVWDCGSDKAPGPDGISFRFIKRFWDILQIDFYRDIRGIFNSSRMPLSANSAFFSLIPKVKNLVFITDFRPVTLVGCFYKIVTKNLTNRLLLVIDKIISQVQSAFIFGRQILDGPLMLSEIISWYIKTNRKMLLFKVIFEKAYDSVSGLRLNVTKSQLFCIGVKDSKVTAFANAAGTRAGFFSTTYLGLLVGSNMKLTSS
ncbi:uncharacterized protein [Rutidosis leptorrhynchoides]|uniref:uncharacterized protein n=1 Tax=Rutidosis leptorrhynchoides TaxID=125765 RepID=UPI003A997290